MKLKDTKTQKDVLLMLQNSGPNQRWMVDLAITPSVLKKCDMAILTQLQEKYQQLFGEPHADITKFQQTRQKQQGLGLRTQLEALRAENTVLRAENEALKARLGVGAQETTETQEAVVEEAAVAAVVEVLQ